MELQTYKQIQSLHRWLKRHFKGLPGLMSIAFGCASQESQPDPGRGFSACFCVERKKKRVPADQRIPPRMRLEKPTSCLRRGLEIPTDVVECPQVRPVGRKLGVDTGSVTEIGTAGILLGWKQDGEAKAGFVTAGHLFKSVPTGQVVDLANVGGQFRVFGRLLAKSSSGSKADLGLVQVQETSITEFTPPVKPSPVDIWTPDAIAAALSASPAISLDGSILRIDGETPITVRRIHPEFQIQQIGIIRDLLDADRNVAGTFAGGTSGAAWLIDGKLAGVQTAGFEDVSFKRGLAQLYSKHLEWATKLISELPGFKAGSLVISAVY